MAKTKINRIIPYALPVVVFTLAALYYFYNPMVKSTPIRCLWQMLTGTQCPACGSQRALHALMNGRFLEALRYNYFFVISIPYLLLLVITKWYNYHHKLDRLKAIVFHNYTVYTFLILLISWWIVRNLLHI